MAQIATNAAIGIGISSVLITIIGAFFLKKVLGKLKNSKKIPTEWVKVGTVKELYIFPMKSTKGIKSEKLFLTEKGVREIDKNDNTILLQDRTFCIYTSKDLEVRSARQLPKIIQISIQAASNGVILKAPNKVDLYINLPKVKNNIRAKFGKELFTLTDCGHSVANWLSSFLLNKNEGLRLGYGTGNPARTLVRDNPKLAGHYPGFDDTLAGIFSDYAALHAVNAATVQNLNERLENGVDFMNFRPNILIEGPEAFAEDRWTFVKFGNVVTESVMECPRCITTTVSSSGVFHEERQPLKTLDSYRKSEGPIKTGVMGTYHKVLKTGVIHLGDSVYVPK
ncbi:unnamed protein product [Ceutorhynchus assimilis]|uniref:MOSC domain-containing protein n=1 Tax=Ceutorhynchus assimilis TaxID=467358 RepID=A0A9N9MIH7_9CUCU|nr:unnamed protein product [Ceutorhynchus assimilis]